MKSKNACGSRERERERERESYNLRKEEKKLFERKIKSKKGITLIALVVTIIVLLILASVSVTVVFGDNGLIQMAKEAKEQSELKGLEESVNLALANRNIKKEAGMSLESLETDLETIRNVEVEEVADDLCYVTREGRTVSVYENGDIVEGRIDVWDGEGIEVPEIKEFNWYIYTGAQLSFLREFVNNGNTLTEDQRTLVQAEGYNESDITITEETIVYLMNDIDLGARQKDGILSTPGQEWTPIGLTKELAFKGTFDGKEHTIRGIYVNRTDNFSGLFGISSNLIKNVKIKDSYIEAGNCMGGIVGLGTKIENCHNINTTVVQKEGEYYTIGGIAGQINKSIKDCSNSGTVIGNGMMARFNNLTACGGIVGQSMTDTSIENCNNSGNIYGKGFAIGGITGASISRNINNCCNSGNVTGKAAVGGLIGYAQSGSIEYCYNNGNIEGCDEYVGGIAGETGGIIKKCYNEGKVIGVKLNNYMVERIGGVAGGTFARTTVSIENCYNIGEINLEGVEKSEKIGGIIGYISATGTSNGTIKNNYNIGTIEGKNMTEVGGAVGHCTTDQFTIEKNYYKKGIMTSEDNTFGEAIEEEEMKKQDFVDLLNNGQDEEVWEIVQGRNGGFPIIIGM